MIRLFLSSLILFNLSACQRPQVDISPEPKSVKIFSIYPDFEADAKINGIGRTPIYGGDIADTVSILQAWGASNPVFYHSKQVLPQPLMIP